MSAFETGTGAVGVTGPTGPTGAASDVDNTLPWTIDINPFSVAATHTNWGSFITDAAAPYIGGGTRESSGAQNAEVGWDVVLAAGTWTLEIIVLTHNAAGIITAKIDGTDIGTMDLYSAGLTYNVVKSITGISVATSGKKRLLFKMATKNGSSGNYYGEASQIRLLRTA